MHELHAVLEAWRGLPETDRAAVLATVVRVKGSAYRRPGARMLILPDGRRIGTISGGCLEGEVTKKAWWFTESGRPVVNVYDTSSGDDAVWEFGLGCNGVIHVMLERVDGPEARATLEFLDARRGEATVAAVAIRDDEPSGVRAGDRLLLDGSGVWSGALAQSALGDEVRRHAETALRDGRSFQLRVGAAEFFVECVAPPLPLVVFGAGHDAVPLVSAAVLMGWAVTVADPRPAYAFPNRFAGAERVVTITPSDAFREISITAESAVVMMTHNYPLDRTLLPEILAGRPRYLGMLGPRSRSEQLFAEIGMLPPASVHAPAGLDTGGDTPAGIALSIVSEIQTAISGRSGGMLKWRNGPIHAPSVEVGSADEARDLDRRMRPAYCETVAGSHV